MRRTLPIILMAVVLPLSASAATLSLDPASGSYGPGDTIIATIRLDPGSQCINAAHVELAYPPSELRAVDFSKGDSIFSLWVEGPQIDNTTGRITFSGGVPAGYCGRIPGDPAESNALGQVIFTVLQSGASTAAVRLLPASAVYLNDGRGTQAALSVQDATYELQATTTQAVNPWVKALSADTIPPQPFVVQVESTPGVFGGAYYAVFSTVDLQSGMDHYEIFENGAWRRATSPHVLADQSLSAPVLVRAIDKAGNIRDGTYNASTTPPRASGGVSSTAIVVILAVLALLLLGRWFWERRHASAEPPLS